MKTSDIEEFDELMRKLCAGFDKPVSKERSDAFWTGCVKLSIGQFRRGVDAALARIDVGFPRPKHIVQFAREAEVDVAEKQHNDAQRERMARDAQYPPWLAAVNQLFVIWLCKEINAKRRRIYIDQETLGCIGKPRSIPQREMLARRAACRRLADDFAGMEREGDTAATREALRTAFDTHMRLIAVDNPA